MGTSDLTESERLFVEFCGRESIPYERLAENGMPVPDFYIRPAGQTIVVEVKEIEANRKEKEELRSLSTRGIASLTITPGERVRSKIKKAMPQLHALAKGQYPSMLVLLNVSTIFQHTEPYAILTAMYGLQAVRLRVPSASGQPITSLGDFHGPQRKVGPDHNTTLSAVGVMAAAHDDAALDIFHNVYAAIPLPLASLKGPRIRHFGLQDARASRFTHWVEL